MQALLDYRNVGTMLWAGAILFVMIRSVVSSKLCCNRICDCKQVGGVSKLERTLLIGGVFVFVPFLPCMHLLSVGYVVAERLVYMSTIGYCLVLTVLLWAATRTLRAATLALCLVALVQVLAVMTINRSVVWRSEHSLYYAAIRTGPSCLARHNLAHQVSTDHPEVSSTVSLP